MIFVTVGTHTKSFNRLLKEVDGLVGKGKIKEKVVIQIGHSSYKPKNVKWFRFTTFPKLKNLCKKARIIITHGGAGSILIALDNAKPVIAVPRLKKFDEHVNDHQLDLVKFLEKEGNIEPVYNISKLGSVISKIHKSKNLKTTKKTLCKEIEKFLENIR